MTDDHGHKPPKSSSGDVVHAIAKAGLSSVPLVGSAASELFALIVTPPLEKRRQKWMEEIGQALQQLESKRGVRLEDLQNDDTFIDTVMSASQAAIRTSREEKREALRNAVINAALPGSPDDSTQQTFVALVDQFTEWHLRLLKLFEDPRGWAKRHHVTFPSLMAGSPANILEAAYPDLRGKQEFYGQIWKDLHQRGLVNTDSLGGLMSGEGAVAKRTNALGDQFLRFIADPGGRVD